MANEKIQALLRDVQSFSATGKDDLENFRLRFFGKKGELQGLFGLLKSAPPEEKREIGQEINDLKQAAQQKLDEEKANLESAGADSAAESIDLTLDAAPAPIGSLHPLTKVQKQITDIFERLGFTISEGPEIVNDWQNFTALNTPEDHPARDMQDTFYVTQDPDILLRTHTSAVQVRIMEQGKPPIRTISPGRVYRNETVSARAHFQFHQVEGLYIDEEVSFADLKQVLYYFAQEMFGRSTEIRFRASYFPFTEISAEMDITCLICSGSGCPVCKHSGWVEIMGCGMVDPAVLENCRIDPEKFTGFAFGMGVERIAMLKYRINDIRIFYENDVRFLEQFKGV